MESGQATFVATHWSMVLNAGSGDSPQAREALERLCAAYWFPLYAHVRRRGHRPEDACDLTQEFFASLLRYDSLSQVGPEKGRFRSFLLTSLNYFLADQADYRNAARRGGGRPLVELDALAAEERYAIEPATTETPDKAFDRRWVAELMARAITRVEEEQADLGKAEGFARLKPFLAREPEPGEYEVIAAPLGLTPNAIAASVRRLRLKLREVALAEVSQTMANPADAEAELKCLLG